MKYQSQLWNVFKNYQPFRVKKTFVGSFNHEMYLLFNVCYCLPFFFFSCYIVIGVWGKWRTLKSKMLSKLGPRKDHLGHLDAFLMSSIGADVFHGGCQFCFQTCSSLWLTSLIILVKPIFISFNTASLQLPIFLIDNLKVWYHSI